MHFTQALAIASTAALVAAVPAPVVKLEADDVVLYGNNGRFTKMKRADLDNLEELRNSGKATPTPGYLDSSLITYTGDSIISGNYSVEPVAGLTKRAGVVSLVIPGPDSRFLGWDVLTSTVARGAPTTVSISTGISISNSISVGASATFSLIKDFLSATVSINYSKTWQTSQSQSFTVEVPKDKFGAIVTNAWTNRKSGNVWEGTIGGEGTLTPYQADSFEEKQYGDLSWVDGVLGLCTGDEFPLKRCLGEGTL